MAEDSGISSEHLAIRDVAMFNITPLGEGEVNLMRTRALAAKAVIFTVAPTGASPEELNPLIQDCTEKGIPVL